MKQLCAEKISKTFDEKKVVEDIDIVLDEGETVSLLGVSGSGKTTIFNILSGLLSPDSGRVMLDDEDITGSPGKISYMLQKDLLFNHKKIIDNVSLPLVIKGMKKKDAREKAKPYFESFGLHGMEQKYPAQLSGGMRQRAALLRTYLASEGIVLLDEPFSALDAITKASMHRWYLDISKEMGLSTLLITHDIDEAIILSDKIYILSGKPGKISARIDIKEEKPRGDDFNLTEEFLTYKRQIIENL